MSTKRINHRRPHDSVLAGYNNFLNNSKLDENGNPFSETLVRVSQLPDWALTKHRQLGIFAADGGNPLRHKANGPPSLWDMVRRFLNSNLKNLSVEALEAVPWELMKYIWTDVLATGQDSFRTWALFASVYGHEPDFTCVFGGASQQRNRKAFINRSIPMDSLLAPISSPTFQWLVDLDLQTSTGYTRFDFLELPSLPNLSALNISRHHQDLDIDDGIIRTWGMAAARQGKFTMLRVLVARNHLQVTSRALVYLSWIESLEVIDVTGCGVIGTKEIQQLGWVKDFDLADTIEDPPEIWKIMRMEKKEEKGAQLLVVSVKVEAPQPMPKRVGARNPMLFRRENNSASAKRKHSIMSHSQAAPYPKMTSYNAGVTLKKPKVLRDYRKKDMGGLLAEFGIGSGRGGPSR